MQLASIRILVTNYLFNPLHILGLHLGTGLLGLLAPFAASAASSEHSSISQNGLSWMVIAMLIVIALLAFAWVMIKRHFADNEIANDDIPVRVDGDASNVIAWEYDTEKKSFVYISANRLLGMPVEEWCKPGFWQSRIHPEDREFVLYFFRSQTNKGSHHELEYRMMHGDGYPVYVHDIRTLRRNKKGKLIGIRGIVLDVSSHKASEHALEESEARFRSSFEQAAVGMGMCAIGGHYVRVNRRYCEITGYTEKELLSIDFRDITHADDLDANEHLLDELVLGSGETYSMEKRLKRKDGTYCWVNLTMCIVKLLRKEPNQFMEVIEDITARKSAEAELRQSENRMRTVLSAMHEAVIMRDPEGRAIMANSAARKIYGVDDDDPSALDLRTVQVKFLRTDGSYYAVEELPVITTLRTGVPQTYELGIERMDGTLVWGHATAEPLLNMVDKPPYPVVVTVRDITEQRNASEQLQLAATVFKSSVEAIMICNPGHHIISVNPAFSSLTGYASEEVVEQNADLLMPKETLLPMEDTAWQEVNDKGYWQGEVHYQRKDGHVFPCELNISAVRDTNGRLTHYVLVFADITERKENEARIAFLAHHDPLTELPNRALLQDRLEQALGRAAREEIKVALLFLDLDRFKTINDSLGHHAGDRLLRAVAGRLLRCVRDTDTVCRQGGDEFIIVLSDIVDSDAAARVAEKILERLAEPFEVGGHTLGTSFSIGIAVYPDDGATADVLMKNADTAMYHAKESGRNTYRFFTEAMNANALERLQIENLLRHALERNEFVLHFQPQIAMDTGDIVGAEVLLRWNHPTQGLVAPTSFIPIAEESGLIIPIGRWVLREACLQVKAWHDRGLPKISVAVNLSALQFKREERDDITVSVQQVLEETGLEAEYLELELTESILMQHAEEVLATVKKLKALGVRLSIDDFGTGYSSLSYLKRFAVDRLKIDQSFVRDVVVDPDDAAIVRAIIQLGKSLKLDVIAEGAETAAQVEFLRKEGCREAQGYYFCPPLTSDEFVDVLTTGSIPQSPQQNVTRISAYGNC